MRLAVRSLFAALLLALAVAATTPSVAGAATKALSVKQLAPTLKATGGGRHSIRVAARTRAGATCRVTVRVKKARQTLRTLKATKRGRVAWRWQILDESPSGTWRIAVSCKKGKSKGTSSRRVLVVTKSKGSRGPIGNPNSLDVVDGEPAGRGGASCGPFTDRSLPGGGKQCTCLAWEKRRDVYDTSVSRGVPASGWNGSRWLVNAQRGGFATGTAPVKGALVVWGTLAASDYGHVAYVENVESATRIQITECNYDWKGSCRTVWMNPLGRANLQGYVYGGPAGGGSPSGSPSPGAGPGTTSGPGLFGALLNDGSFHAKQGIGGTWTHLTGSVKQIAIGGNYIGALLHDGTFVAKQGIGGTWVTETGNVKQIAIAGDYIGALLNDGTFVAKQGIGGTWTTLTGSVKQITAGHTGIFGALLNDRSFHAKHGIGGTWTHLTSNVKQIAIAGDYIGALLNDGTFVAKQGIGGTWTTLTGSVNQITAGHTGIFGALLNDGSFHAKHGIGGTWTHLTSNVKQIAIAGDYIGALLNDGTFVAKQGIGGTWTTLTGSVAQIAVAP